MAPLWYWAVFAFVLGICVGSFLNVVIWRLPRGGSVRKPARSYCPRCEKAIAWYDNLPIVSWVLLRARCRHCGQPISIRYPLIELLTGLLFVALLLGVYANQTLRPDLGPWPANWPGYLAALILASGLLAGSVIDLEHFFIPLPVVWIGGLAAVALATIFPGPWLPMAGPQVTAVAVGGTAGLLIAMGLLWLGLLPLSFPGDVAQADPPPPPPPGKGKSKNKKKNKKDKKSTATTQPAARDSVGLTVGARREVLKEVLFLGPVAVGAIVWWMVAGPDGPLWPTWARWCQSPHLAGLGGSLFGLLIGGGVIWSVRILGTLVAGREAMGLGDVHLLAAAGALLGWGGATLAFFISPFFGLAVGLVQWLRRGQRELPYGPYLTLGILAVLASYDRLESWLLPSLRLLFTGDPGL